MKEKRRHPGSLVLGVIVSLTLVGALYIATKTWYGDNMLWPPVTHSQQTRLLKTYPEIDVPAGYWNLACRYTDVTAYGLRGEPDPTKVKMTADSLIRSGKWAETGANRIGGMMFRSFEGNRGAHTRIYLCSQDGAKPSICIVVIGEHERLDAFGKSEQFRELVRRSQLRESTAR